MVHGGFPEIDRITTGHVLIVVPGAQANESVVPFEMDFVHPQ